MNILINIKFENPTNIITENGCYTQVFKREQTIMNGMHRGVNHLSDVKIGYSLGVRNRKMYEYGERVISKTYIL